MRTMTTTTTTTTTTAGGAVRRIRFSDDELAMLHEAVNWMLGSCAAVDDDGMRPGPERDEVTHKRAVLARLDERFGKLSVDD